MLVTLTLNAKPGSLGSTLRQGEYAIFSPTPHTIGQSDEFVTAMVDLRIKKNGSTYGRSKNVLEGQFTLSLVPSPLGSPLCRDQYLVWMWSISPRPTSCDALPVISHYVLESG